MLSTVSWLIATNGKFFRKQSLKDKLLKARSHALRINARQGKEMIFGSSSRIAGRNEAQTCLVHYLNRRHPLLSGSTRVRRTEVLEQIDQGNPRRARKGFAPSGARADRTRNGLSAREAFGDAAKYIRHHRAECLNDRRGSSRPETAVLECFKLSRKEPKPNRGDSVFSGTKRLVKPLNIL